MRYFSILTLLFFACTSSNTPEGVLREFVIKRFTGKIDRDAIEKYTGGELKEEIDSMDEEEFNLYTSIGFLQKGKLSISHKRCEASKCYITYILTYNTMEGEKKVFQTDTKKIAEVQSLDNLWRITK
jgi:hypothetical protein